jgi:outer membrane protein assembly factor BamB
MSEILNCPTCGAPLDSPQAGHRTVRCPFCNNNVVLPGALGPTGGVPAIQPNVTSAKGPAGLRAWALVASIGIILVIAVVIVAVVLVSRIRTPPPQINPRPINGSIVIPTGLSPSPSPSGFAETVLSFGSEGVGPGLFSDARTIAVDQNGTIYVGDYSGGRVQVFDPGGKFVTQWLVDTKMPLVSMAADRKGAVYVVQRGEISRYEGATGKPLGRTGGGSFYEDVVAMPDGSFLGWEGSPKGNIVRLDANLRTTRTIEGAISKQTDDLALHARLAADGQFNTYALETMENAVFKFAPDGKYVSRFGSSGDAPGQFRAPWSIAADGHGRVYVGDFKGIQVFDSNGRYLATIKHAGGVAFGMTFDDHNDLLVAARDRVLKLRPAKP